MTASSVSKNGAPTFMKADPFFSVLVATYNQAHYLTETLDSVRHQTFTDWELVVVDDGSTDATSDVLAQWVDGLDEATRARVKVLEQPNSGQSAAFEAGFELCKGRYIALLDSDDRWLPERLEVVARVAEKHPEAGMLAHPMWVIDAEGRRTGDVRPRRSDLSSGDLRDQIRNKGQHLVTSSTSGIVIRSDVFAKLVPMPTKKFRSAADAYLTFGASLLAPVHAIRSNLAEYRIHADGNYIRRILSPEGLERQLEIQRTIVAHFGLERVAHRNSYYARNAFAAARLRGSRAAEREAYRRLILAVATDASFSMAKRIGYIGFWSAGFVAPKAGFLKMWEWFHRLQAGASLRPGHPRPVRGHAK